MTNLKNIGVLETINLSYCEPKCRRFATLHLYREFHLYSVMLFTVRIQHLSFQLAKASPGCQLIARILHSN